MLLASRGGVGSHRTLYLPVSCHVGAICTFHPQCSQVNGQNGISVASCESPKFPSKFLNLKKKNKNPTKHHPQKNKTRKNERTAEKQMRCLESQKLIQHFLFMHTKNDSLKHFFPKEARVYCAVSPLTTQHSPSINSAKFI